MLALDSLLSSTMTSIEEESFEESSLGQVDTTAMSLSKLSMDRCPNFGKPSETGCQMRRPLEVPMDSAIDNDGLHCGRISALEEAAAQLSKLQTSDAPEFWKTVVSDEHGTSVSVPSVLWQHAHTAALLLQLVCMAMCMDHRRRVFEKATRVYRLALTGEYWLVVHIFLLVLTRYRVYRD